jgi:hypothetical protein
MVEVVTHCPLINAPCNGGEQIKDGKLHRCAAWMQFTGQRQSTTGEMEQTTEWGCWEFDWKPRLKMEEMKINRGTTAAVESFRNEMVDGNKTIGQLIAHQNQRLIELDI